MKNVGRGVVDSFSFNYDHAAPPGGFRERRNVKKGLLFTGLSFLFLTLSVPLKAQESSEDLSKQAANPMADLISIPIQHNIDFGLGEYDRTRNLLNIQPVIPLAGGKIITRTVMPIVWQPDTTSESGMYSSPLPRPVQLAPPQSIHQSSVLLDPTISP